MRRSLIPAGIPLFLAALLTGCSGYYASHPEAGSDKAVIALVNWSERVNTNPENFSTAFDIESYAKGNLKGCSSTEIASGTCAPAQAFPASLQGQIVRTPNVDGGQDVCVFYRLDPSRGDLGTAGLQVSRVGRDVYAVQFLTRDGTPYRQYLVNIYNGAVEKVL